MKWLVKFADNWADEINVSGLSIMNEKEFMEWARAIERAAKKIDSGKELTHWIGTNEMLIYECGKELKNVFACEVISDESAEIIQQIVIGENSTWYGHFITKADLNFFLCEGDN